MSAAALPLAIMSVTSTVCSDPAPQPRAAEPFTLAELAEAVRLAAWAEAAGLADLEVMAARSAEPAFARVRADVALQGRRLGAVHALLMRMVAAERAGEGGR